MFIDQIEKLLNFKESLLKKLAFNIYDYDQDKSVCEFDLYTIFKTYEHDDNLFTSAFLSDITKIEDQIR